MNLIFEIFEFVFALITGLFSRGEAKPSDFQNADILIFPGLGAGSFFYKKLEDSLKSAGYSPLTIPLPTWKSEKETTAHVAQALSQASDRITIIAHNTSGLAMGALPDSARRKIDTLVTLGTPYRGFQLLNLFTFSGWEPDSSSLELRLPAYLFINHFHPLSPILEYIFFPRGEQLLYGQGRDQWFDIPGNYNLVRRKENLRTLVEYLQTIHPVVPKIPEGTITLPDITYSPTDKVEMGPAPAPKKKKSPKKKTKTTDKRSSVKKIPPKKKISKKQVAKKKRK